MFSCIINIFYQHATRSNRCYNDLYGPYSIAIRETRSSIKLNGVICIFSIKHGVRMNEAHFALE